MGPVTRSPKHSPVQSVPLMARCQHLLLPIVVEAGFRDERMEHVGKHLEGSHPCSSVMELEPPMKRTLSHWPGLLLLTLLQLRYQHLLPHLGPNERTKRYQSERDDNQDPALARPNAFGSENRTTASSSGSGVAEREAIIQQRRVGREINREQEMNGQHLVLLFGFGMALEYRFLYTMLECIVEMKSHFAAHGLSLLVINASEQRKFTIQIHDHRE